MKKIMIMVALFATTFAQHASAKIVTDKSQLLDLYYNIKDALVTGNSNEATAKAAAFVTTLQAIDEKAISSDNRNALLKYAGLIAATKELQHQREHFADFSTSMATLLKAVKLTDKPVYQAYCPMKKAYWLSNTKEIKNPYYGSAMLTCGKVTDTIQ
ncbi:MAG: DUF3347 domain-containing protein [Chitinophagaceae bacterium]